MSRFYPCRRDNTSLINVFSLFSLFVLFHYMLLVIEKPGSLQSGNSTDITVTNHETLPEIRTEQNIEISKDKDMKSERPQTRTQSFEKFKPRRKNGGGRDQKSRENSKGKKNIFLEDHIVDFEDKWTDEQMEEREKVLKERSSAVSAACERFDENDALYPNITKVHSNIRWVSKYNFIWCPVYKAASTTWMNNLLLLAGIKVANMSYHKRVRELYPQPEDQEEKEKLLKNSMKMLIVRNPLERLLSAYRDKMLREDQFKRLRLSLLKKFPDPKTADENHPTFWQFLMHIRSEMRRFWKSGGKSPINNHWQPVWWACGPCQVTYNAIAHVETLDLDQEYIIRKAGITNLAFNAHTHASNFDSLNGTSQASQHYFSQIPQKLLSEIAELYRPDFSLFGYSPNDIIQMGKE